MTESKRNFAFYNAETDALVDVRLGTVFTPKVGECVVLEEKDESQAVYCIMSICWGPDDKGTDDLMDALVHVEKCDDAEFFENLGSWDPLGTLGARAAAA